MYRIRKSVLSLFVGVNKLTYTIFRLHFVYSNLDMALSVQALLQLKEITDFTELVWLTMLVGGGGGKKTHLYK